MPRRRTALLAPALLGALLAGTATVRAQDAAPTTAGHPAGSPDGSATPPGVVSPPAAVPPLPASTPPGVLAAPAPATPLAPAAAPVPAAPPVPATPGAASAPPTVLAGPADTRSPSEIGAAFGSFLGGQFALSQNAPEAAAPLLLQALSQDPGSAILQQQAFLACVLAGRPEAASLARDLPTSPVALLLLGDQAAASGNWAEAQRRFAALPQQPLTEVLRPLAVAWAQQGAGDTDGALATLQPMLGRTSSAGIYALHAGLIADQAGRTGDADRYFQTAQAEFAGLNLRLAQIVASFEARHGRAAEAEATLRNLVQQQPPLAIAEQGLLAAALGQGATPPVPRPVDGLAEAYFALAATLRQQNADGFAEVLLRLTLALRPDFTAARLLMADVLEAQGRTPDALALLQAVPATDPLAPVARLREAQLDARSGHPEDAARLLNALARAHPDSPDPLSLLASVQSGQKRYAEAAATLDHAIARVPHPGPADWTLFYQRGVALDLAHQWPRAQADLEHALQLSPDQPQVLNYLGYSWADQGRNLPRARQMLQKAVAAQPNNGAIADSLGWALLRQGDVAGAVRWMERACELDPVDAELNGHLGDAYWAAGRHGEAMDQWRRALSLDPEPDERARIEARLHAGDAAPRGHAPLPAAHAEAAPVVPGDAPPPREP